MSRGGRRSARRAGPAPRVRRARHGALARRGAGARLPRRAGREGAAHDRSRLDSAKRRGGEMKSRLLFVLLVAAVGAAVYGGKVLATSSQGFTGTTLAKATFGEIDSHVVAEPGWQEKIKTQ